MAGDLSNHIFTNKVDFARNEGGKTCIVVN